MRHWSRNTQLGVVGVTKKWKAYVHGTWWKLQLAHSRYGFCTTMKFEDWEKEPKNTDRAKAMDFVLFMCDNYRITKGQTLWQYFCAWKRRESMSVYVCRSSSSTYLRVIAVYHMKAGQEFSGIYTQDVLNVRIQVPFQL
jgi:hypothetical protein